MSVRHLRGSDDWYVINVDRTDESDSRPSRHSRLVSLHGPGFEAKVEWSLLSRRYNFGWGVQFGRNGGESDLGLSIYLGWIGSVWLRLRAPWTTWARVTKEQDPQHWYYARHTGIRVHPHKGCLLNIEIEARDGYHSSSDPWWRDWSITRYSILGKQKSEHAEGLTGTCEIPLPEGVYPATWVEKISVTHHVRWPGTWRDRLLGARHARYIDLRIDGGIPVEGKGESDWDCGMDGLFGCSGATVEAAVANAVGSVLKDRQRYGGPHGLTRPMTVQEAEQRHKTS